MNKKLKIVLGTLLLVSVCTFTGCSKAQHYDKQNHKKTVKTISLSSDEEKDTYVSAEIYAKHYIEAETKTTMQPVCVGKNISMIPMESTEGEKYLVTLRYEDIIETVDNKDLYNRVRKGDRIKVRLFKSWTGRRSLML